MYYWLLKNHLKGIALVNIFSKEFLYIHWGFSNDLFRILLIIICSTDLSVNTEIKSFNEITLSSIRKYIQSVLIFNPDCPETGRK